jgi:hypothetical protein
MGQVYSKIMGMKTERISFVIKAPKKRVHKMLFDRDFNFRGKRQDDKHSYKRRPKFQNRDDSWEDL